MAKNIKRLMVVAVAVIALVVFTGAYQIVRTEGGYHLMRKKEFKMSAPVLDTRDWKLSDWVKNPEISKLRLDEMKDKATDGWKKFSKKVDGWVEDAGKKLDGDSVSKELARLQERASEEHRKLAKKLREGKIDTKEFEKKMDELGDWFQKKIDQL